MQDFYGDVFYLIKKAEEYILEHINIGMRLDGLFRVDVPEIDREAFREGIVNAFCHRDYREYDSVNIAIFKDRVEIRSPGLLYGGLTVADIRRKMLSERRNERFAELFQRGHFIEKWGRGIKMILEREPHTEFDELGTHFIATFKRNSYEITKPEVSGEVFQKTPVKTPDMILAYLAENPHLSLADIAPLIGKSLSSVERACAKLVKFGKLRFVGPQKGGHWEITNE